ncbi:60S ribosomal protein L18 [Lemmus lemmus]
MGVDISHNKDPKVQRKKPKSQNIYLWLLVKLYRFLARLTNSTFNQVMLKSLFMKNMAAVVVGTITDDVRILEVPKLKVCALRILKAGDVTHLRLPGLEPPKGCNTVLLSTPWKDLVVYLVAFWQGPRNHTQPYQTLCLLQVPEV